MPTRTCVTPCYSTNLYLYDGYAVEYCGSQNCFHHHTALPLLFYPRLTLSIRTPAGRPKLLLGYTASDGNHAYSQLNQCRPFNYLGILHRPSSLGRHRGSHLVTREFNSPTVPANYFKLRTPYMSVSSPRQRQVTCDASCLALAHASCPCLSGGGRYSADIPMHAS
eukprot:1173990-Prorocentrum_minimum.AAC.1